MCIVLVNKSQNIVLSVKTTHKVGLLTRNIRIKASLGSTCREGKKVQHIHIFHSKNAYFYLSPYRVQCLQMLCFYKTSYLLNWHCADLWGIRAPSPWRAGRWPGEQLELFHNATYNYIGWEHTLTSNICYSAFGTKQKRTHYPQSYTIFQGLCIIRKAQRSPIPLVEFENDIATILVDFYRWWPLKVLAASSCHRCLQFTVNLTREERMKEFCQVELF